MINACNRLVYLMMTLAAMACVSACNMGSGGGPVAVNLANSDAPLSTDLTSRIDAEEIKAVYQANMADARASYPDAEDVVLAHLRAQDFEIVEGMEPLEAYTKAIIKDLTGHLAVGDALDTVRVMVYHDTYARALVTPLHVILISTEMLKELQGGDEYAGLIAHELSHILLGHFRADAFREQQDKLARALSIGSLLFKAEVKDEETMTSEGTAGKLALGSQAFRDFAKAVMTPSWVRSEEEQADLFGFDLIVAAKDTYNPQSFGEFLINVGSAFADTKAVMARYFELARDRTSRLLTENIAGEVKRELARTTSLEVMTSVFRAVDRLGCDYFDEEERYLKWETYKKAAYNDAQLSYDGWGDTRYFDLVKEKNSPLHQILSDYWKVSDHIRATEQGQTAESVSEGLTHASGAAGQSGLLRFSLFQGRIEQAAAAQDVQSAEQYRASALKNLQYGAENPNATGEQIGAYARAMADAGRKEQALQVLEKGRQALGSQDLFLEDEIYVYAAAGDQIEAGLRVTACVQRGMLKTLSCLAVARSVNPDIVEDTWLASNVDEAQSNQLTDWKQETVKIAGQMVRWVRGQFDSGANVCK